MDRPTGAGGPSGLPGQICPGSAASSDGRPGPLGQAPRKDGATFPVEISLTLVPTTTEKFVLAVIRDATQTRWRDDLADLARGAVADQGCATKDLLDRVSQRLFQVGLSLQAAAGLPGDVARERLSAALDQLDDAIHEIRDYTFSSGGQGPAGNVT